MIDVSFTWEMILGGVIGSLPGVILSRWLGYRDGKSDAKKERKEHQAKSPGSGPYRTPAELTDPPIGLDPAAEEEQAWLYDPQTTCPRCSNKHNIQHRGRFTGDHALGLVSQVMQQTVKCEGHKPVPHLHFQCWSCGADWAEVPPEDYGNDDEDEEDDD